MKKLIFTPFTEKQINNLLLDNTPINANIKAIKVKQWINLKENEILYGLDVIDLHNKTFGMCEGNKAIIFKDKKTANKVCKELKKKINAPLSKLSITEINSNSTTKNKYPKFY